MLAASRSGTNVSYVLLDAAVIAGAADEPLLRSSARDWSHARLLEEVAAIGGVLRHLGVGPGVVVVLDLVAEHDVEAVVGALATARLGGVVSTREEDDAVVVCSGGSLSAGGGERPRLVRATASNPVTEPDLDWEQMVRAGRTDPAAVTLLDPGAAYSRSRDVAAQVGVLGSGVAPYDPAELRALLQA